MSSASDFVIENGVLEKYVGPGGDVVIPEGVTCIGEYAFFNCCNMTNITIPDSVARIGEFAFAQCAGLKNTTIPGTVLKIGRGAFTGCGNLEKATLSEGINAIERDAFYECSSLAQLVIPKSVVIIAGGAFANCKSLVRTVIPDSSVSIESGAFKNCDNVCFVLPERMRYTKESISGEFARGTVDAEEESLAYLILFQKSPLWKAWRNASKFENPQHIFDFMVDIVKNEPFDKRFAPPVADIMLKYYRDLTPTSMQTMLALFDGKKCKEILELQKDEGIKARLENRIVNKHPAEADAEALIVKYGTVPAVEKDIQKGIHYRDTNITCTREVLVAILSYYAKEWQRCATDIYHLTDTPIMLVDARKVRIAPDVDSIAEALDQNELVQLLEKLISGYMRSNQYRMYLLSWARFADDASVARTIDSYQTLIRGEADERRFAENMAEAILINETRTAMLFCDRMKKLDRYAEIRGMQEDDLRVGLFSDIGLDAKGCKTYDLGNQTVTARLQKDLTFEFELPGGKTVKSLPKKNADPDKYNEAKADFDEMRKSAKIIVKSRCKMMLRDFLNGSEKNAADWRSVNTENPLLRSVAETVVWTQAGKTFILAGGKSIDSAEQPCTITDEKIKVAHPMEMHTEDIAAWQKYFTAHGLKQPFLQAWEPIYEPTEIKQDRYEGCLIPYYRFMNQEAHGIISSVYDLIYNQDVKITLADCDVEIRRVDRSRRIDPNDRFEIKSFTFKTYTRQVNHLVAYFDRVTVWDRVRKDDLTVIEQLDRFTFAQIMEFIAAAQEANVTNVLAALLDYKNAHFADFDPMAEFTLDW